MSRQFRLVAIAAAGLLSVSACTESDVPGGSSSMDASIDADAQTAPDIPEEDASDVSGDGDTWSWPDVPDEIERGPEEWTQLEGFYGGELVTVIDENVIARTQDEQFLYTTGDGRWQSVSELPLAAATNGSFGDGETYAETDDHRYLMGSFDDDFEMAVLESPRGSTEFQEIPLPDVEHAMSLHAVNGQLILLNRGGDAGVEGDLHRLTDTGTWERITPGGRFGLGPPPRITAKAGLLVSPDFSNQETTLQVSTDTGQSWRRLGENIRSFRRYNSWAAFDGKLYARVPYNSPAEGGVEPAIVELNHRPEVRRLGLPSQGLSNVMEGGLVTLDGTLYGVGSRGTISKIDVDQREVSVVMDRPLQWPLGANPQNLMSLGDTLYLEFSGPYSEESILTWTPGQDRWTFASVNETSAHRLHANEGHLWGFAGSMRSWQPSSSNWSSATETASLDATSRLVAAGPAMFRRNQPDSELEIWWRSRGWRATGQFETPESDDSSDSTPQKFGYLEDADVFEDGFILGFTRVNQFFGGSGPDPDEDDPNEPAPLGAGLYKWNPANNNVFRFKYNADPDGERPGIRSVTAHNSDIWVSVSPLTNPARRDPSTIYRIRDGRWSQISTDGLNQVRRIQSHDGELYAAISDTSKDIDSFVRWSPSERRFKPLDKAAEDGVRYRKLTSQGPLAVSSTGYFLHQGDTEGWKQIAEPIPGTDSRIETVAVDRATLNVGVAAGGVWSIGIQQR
jgi:hypothetical protein